MERREIREKQEERKRIRACIVDSNNEDSITAEIADQIEWRGVCVDYFGDESFFAYNKMKNSGERTYAISNSDEKDKYSLRYWDCTGIAVVGEDKNSEKQISFLSHQDPTSFLCNKKENFKSHLIASIRELKEKTKEESIDVVIFGGNLNPLGQHKDSIQYIGGILTEEFGFEPTVITGPNARYLNGPTKVYLDTQNRRLYIIRPRNESKANEHYLPSDLEEKSKDWETW